MGLLPEWYSKGTVGLDNNGGFGTSNMFTNPRDEQMGHPTLDWFKNMRMARLLGDGKQPTTPPMESMPQSNMQPQMTPYQGQQMAPNMGQVNNPYAMSPNNQIMPNWNRQYGGY